MSPSLASSFGACSIVRLALLPGYLERNCTVFSFSCLHFVVSFINYSHTSVAVECRDNGNPPYSVKRNFSIQLSDVNEAPFDVRLRGATVVEENVEMGYVIGLVTCKDPDIGQSHVFTVIGNYSSVFQVRSICLGKWGWGRRRWSEGNSEGPNIPFPVPFPSCLPPPPTPFTSWLLPFGGFSIAKLLRCITVVSPPPFTPGFPPPLAPLGSGRIYVNFLLLSSI